MVSILTNTSALGASRQLGASNLGLERSIQRLTSGKRINQAADDAAGLGISNRLGADIRTGVQGRRNVNDGVSTLQVADGVLDEVTSLLTRGVELAEQAQTGTISDLNRVNLDAEFQNIMKTIIDLGLSTKFNGQPLFGTSLSVSADKFGSIDVTIGTVSTSATAALGIDIAPHPGGPSGWLPDGAGGYHPPGVDVFVQHSILTQYWVGYDDQDGNPTTVDYSAVPGWASSLGWAGPGNGWFSPPPGWTPTDNGSFAAYSSVYGAGVATGFQPPPGSMTMGTDNIGTQINAQLVAPKLKDAIEQVSNMRANLGAGMQQLTAVSNTLGIQTENFTAAFSQIRDANIADEVVSLTKFQILNQSGTNALSQANQNQQSLLTLLR